MKVTCTVCGDAIGKMGLGMHAGRHKRDFEQVVGRPPETYDEVRQLYDRDAEAFRPDADQRGPQTTLANWDRNRTDTDTGTGTATAE